MSSPDRDVLWGKYLSTVRCGGTTEQRAFAFGQWWKHEKADALASKRAEQKATKREQAKALR